MNGKLRLRLAVILLVAGVSAALIAGMGIRMGLDLRGGVSIILQVMTDDAVRAATDRAVETVGAEARATRTGDNRIQVAGVDAQRLGALLPDWDASITDGTSKALSARLKPDAEERIRAEAVDQAMTVIDRRLNGLGVGEMTIQRYGGIQERQLLVQWPGFAGHIRPIIEMPAVLEMKLVDGGPFPDEKAARLNYGGAIPARLELLPDNTGQFFAVERSPSVPGVYLRDAYRSRDESGRPAVGFTFNVEGGRLFGQLTEANIGRPLAVVLDHRVQSVAQIQTRISDSGIIRGGGAGFSAEEVGNLVLVLKSGELVAPVHYFAEAQVGASLGADSIRHGVTACIAAMILIVAFMLFYYRAAGLNAVAAMGLNLLILLGSMAGFRATLTLPGIAGIILTMGVGIDSNVLIFERIREEIRSGKTPASAIATGFRRVVITLMDTHVAALISAAFLFAFGAGAIKGFAVTLAIGLASNMFTSVFASRTFFDWMMSRQAASAVR